MKTRPKQPKEWHDTSNSNVSTPKTRHANGGKSKPQRQQKQKPKNIPPLPFPFTDPFF